MAVSTVASGVSNLLSNEIAVAVAHTLQQSLPTIDVVFHPKSLTVMVPSAAPTPVSSLAFSIVSSLAL